MAHEAIQVEGMTCGHCVETVTKAVNSLQGISQVSVSLEDKRVTVDFDDAKTNVQEIASKIKEVGFEVAG